nr:immunoglobulin heavy chain junction region [Mus musculus]
CARCARYPFAYW